MPGVGVFQRFTSSVGESPHLPLKGARDEIGPRWETSVEGRGADARSLRDLLHGHVDPTFGEEHLGGRHNPLPVALRVNSE